MVLKSRNDNKKLKSLGDGSVWLVVFGLFLISYTDRTIVEISSGSK